MGLLPRRGLATAPSQDEGWPPLHWYCLLAWGAVALHLLDLSRLHPDHTLPAYLAEDGPFQNLQLMLLGWALGICGLGLWRFQGDRRQALVFLLGPLFFLFWREADWDKDHLSALLGARQGVRMFSWRYLWSGAEVPTLLKVLWGTVSLGLAAAWLVACWRVRTAWPTLVRLVKTPPVLFWLGLTGGCLALSQVLERVGLVSHTSGVRDPYWEEAPELLGEVALVSFMILLFEHARRKPARLAPPESWFARPKGQEPTSFPTGLISSRLPRAESEQAQAPGRLGNPPHSRPVYRG